MFLQERQFTFMNVKLHLPFCNHTREGGSGWLKEPENVLKWLTDRLTDLSEWVIDSDCMSEWDGYILTHSPAPYLLTTQVTTPTINKSKGCASSSPATASDKARWSKVIAHCLTFARRFYKATRNRHRRGRRLGHADPEIGWGQVWLAHPSL